jgi:RNA polymerase sigma-70 factor (ECF subfamily)
MKKLYTEHHEWALRVARNVIGDTHEAEDVVSEVFLAIHRAMLNGGGPTGNVRGYLRRAIQNEATRVWARRKFETVTDEVPDTEQNDHAEATLRALQRARDLRNCPPMYVLIIFHIDVLGDDAEETARQLNITVPSVKSQLHRARSALRLAA